MQTSDKRYETTLCDLLRVKEELTDNPHIDTSLDAAALQEDTSENEQLLVNFDMRTKHGRKVYREEVRQLYNLFNAC